MESKMMSLFFLFSSLFSHRHSLLCFSFSTSIFSFPLWHMAVIPLHIFLFCVSPLHVFSWAVAAPLTAQIGLNQVAWRKTESVGGCCIFFFFLREKRGTDKKWDTLFSLFYSLDNQLLAESKGRLKGACVEAESADASAPRGYLGPFDSIQSSLHLPTCPQDEKLSSVSAGHKSHSGSGVQIRGELCVCWVFILLCIIQCFYHHKSLSLDLRSHTLVRTILKQDFLNYLSRRDWRRDLKGF